LAGRGRGPAVSAFSRPRVSEAAYARCGFAGLMTVTKIGARRGRRARLDSIRLDAEEGRTGAGARLQERGVGSCWHRPERATLVILFGSGKSQNVARMWGFRGSQRNLPWPPRLPTGCSPCRIPKRPAECTSARGGPDSRGRWWSCEMLQTRPMERCHEGTGAI
jgi:hypothetical protein